MKKFTTKTRIFALIAITLFVIPFFWLKPGEMDLGGDGNRLYFYDPLSNLKAFAIYSSGSWAVGKVAYNQYFIPFLLFMIFLKSIFSSATLLIAIFNGFKLSGSFVFIYLIIKELLRNENKEEITFPQFLASILGALFYTFSPSVIENMRYAIFTHHQIVLNPMIFYLLLRYLVTSSMKYIWVALLVTFIFSINFSLQAPPPLFAFYPLAIVFLLLYNFFILKNPFPWKGIIISTIFFLGLHAFHLIPVVSIIFDKGSEFNTRVFESTTKTNVGLEYFNATLQLGKVSKNIFLPLEIPTFTWSLLFMPFLILLGFFATNKKNKTVFLVSVFFIITLFLASANITQLGVEFYRKLFLIPGFGMFRNFSGQWQWVYTFFYALLAGIVISYLFSKLRKKYIYLLFIIAICSLLIRSVVVFNGDIVNVFHRGSKNLKVVMRMDPYYEKLLTYVKKIPNDGKILHIPFTDFGYNLVAGTNGGVYIGQSMVSFLAGKNDFSGYQDVDPFSEVLVKLSREKNYPLIRQVMSLLQIRYVLYNSDKRISEKFISSFPYGYTGIPASPTAALDFVQNVSSKKIYETGHYSLYEVDKKNYLPRFYAATTIFFYKNNPQFDAEYMRAKAFFPEKEFSQNQDPRIAFLDRSTCRRIFSESTCNRPVSSSDIKNLQIIYKRINPTKYKVIVKNATKPFLLVFQSKFSPHWRIYPSNGLGGTIQVIDTYYNNQIVELFPENAPIDSDIFETNAIPRYDKNHIQINGYANGWYIQPAKAGDINMTIELTSQKTVYYSLGISLISLCAFFLYGLKLFRK